MIFDWDNAKADRNRQKHGVTFDEAQTIWDDPFRYSFGDPDHSQQEQRRIMIGVSDRDRLLFVSHLEPTNGDTTRLISARKATRTERADHEQRILKHLRGSEQ